jgi:phosphoglycerate dehydrogenase-like enzyme
MPAKFLPLLLATALAVHGVRAPADPPTAAAATSTAPSLAELGLQPAAHPVRERPGWRPPKVILVRHELRDRLSQLQQAAPGVRLVDLSAATARDIAAADAAFGICSAEVLKTAVKLQWIQWLAAGVEKCVHEPLVQQRRPLLTNLQRIAAPSMAEHVLALMFALSRQLPYFMREQQQAQWIKWDDAPSLADLEGKTVLVVGLGGIGTEVARRAHALGMRVIATRASGRTGPDFVSYVGLPDELLKLAHEADFVVNCAPLTPETTGIFDKQFFATLIPTAYFINVGRGRSAVTADLIAALGAGTIAGAGLDVVDPEPLPSDSPLWRLPNVIITPHVSANTAVSEAQGAVLLTENLRRYIAGEPMLAVVDIERGY